MLLSAVSQRFPCGYRGSGGTASARPSSRMGIHGQGLETGTMEPSTVRKPKAKPAWLWKCCPCTSKCFCSIHTLLNVFLPLLFQKKSNEAITYGCSSHFLSGSFILYMCHEAICEATKGCCVGVADKSPVKSEFQIYNKLSLGLCPMQYFYLRNLLPSLWLFLVMLFPVLLLLPSRVEA